MKKHTFTLVTVLTVIALLGVIYAQYRWMDNARKLKTELFDLYLKTGIKRVVNQIMSLQHSIYGQQDKSTGALTHNYFITHLEPALIDSMIHTEFADVFPGQKLYYAIYEIASGNFIVCNCEEKYSEILSSPHKAPISCIFQEDQYMLSVLFPGQGQLILREMLVNILSSLIFTFFIILGFWYVIKTFLEQKKLSEIKNDFVNNITHELKTPLTTISVAGEMLLHEKPDDPDQVKKYIQIILDEKNRLQELVDNILRSAVLEKGEMKFRFSPVDIHEIIRKITDKFSITVNNKGGRLMLRLNASNHIVKADSNQIGIVLQNLIDNAVKYSPETPEIIVSTWNNREELGIVIQDNGIGIDPRYHQAIFHQFQRVPSGNVHDVKGYGLGLFFVRKIIEAHGGTIGLTSHPGKGSIFTIRLPFNPPEIYQN